MSYYQDDESNEISSREKTTQWLEGILQIYYSYLKRKENKGAVVVGDPAPPVTVTVGDFDIGPGFSGQGHLSTLSDLLSLKVWYKIDQNLEEKTEHLIVKIPPNDLADREMAHLAQVDKREIHFYTEALVQMQDWIDELGVKLNLSVPRCYFAKYHSQAPSQSQDESNGELAGFGEAESVLVLEDIRPLGYSMREFSIGLTIPETKAALREIAIIHSVSWAMQETMGEELQHKWEFAYRPRKAASAYKMMIEQGFPTLAGFLEKQEPDGDELLSKLKALHPKAADLLGELLEPPPPPAPSCLTHMDFWCNNLLFRTRSPPDVVTCNGDESSVNANGLDADNMDCQIIDWQMMSVGRPTHDIALLLFTSLTPTVRQENTELLLRYYWSVFQSTARTLKVELPFDYSCLEAEFNKSKVLALLLVIGSIDLALDVDSTEDRLMHALRDIAKDGLI